MDTPVESTVGDAGMSPEQSRHKVEPAKGKRYSPAQRREILAYANSSNVRKAAEKFSVTETSIYEWRRANKRRGNLAGDLEGGDPASEPVVEEAREERDRRVLAMWRQHPGYGPS
jgi:transposase-like protein